jgi:hypothetical protein
MITALLFKCRVSPDLAHFGHSGPTRACNASWGGNRGLDRGHVVNTKS